MDFIGYNVGEVAHSISVMVSISLDIADVAGVWNLQCDENGINKHLATHPHDEQVCFITSIPLPASS